MPPKDRRSEDRRLDEMARALRGLRDEFAEHVKLDTRTMTELKGIFKDYHEQNQTKMDKIIGTNNRIVGTNDEQLVLLSNLNTARKVSVGAAKFIRWMVGLAALILGLKEAWQHIPK